LTPDPIGLAGGMNLFVYSESNPINFIDPEGLHGIILFGRTPFFFRPRILRYLPRFLRPRKPFRNTPCEPKYEPRQAPTSEEIGIPPENAWQKHDPMEQYPSKQKPTYNPKNPPKTGVPITSGDPQKPYDPIYNPGGYI
jgi:hypothetical protein